MNYNMYCNGTLISEKGMIISFDPLVILFISYRTTHHVKNGYHLQKLALALKGAQKCTMTHTASNSFQTPGEKDAFNIALE